MRTYTLMDFVHWVQANKRGRAFRFYDDGLVLREIVEGLADGVFSYTEDTNSITGIATGKRLTSKSIYISDVLTTNKEALKQLVERFLLLFPEYSIEGKCRTRKRNFNNPLKLKERLKIYGSR